MKVTIFSTAQLNLSFKSLHYTLHITQPCLFTLHNHAYSHTKTTHDTTWPKLQRQFCKDRHRCIPPSRKAKLWSANGFEQKSQLLSVLKMNWSRQIRVSARKEFLMIGQAAPEGGVFPVRGGF